MCTKLRFRAHFVFMLKIVFDVNLFTSHWNWKWDTASASKLLCTEKGDTMVKYATAGLDPNIFVRKYMIELPSEEEIKAFIASSQHI